MSYQKRGLLIVVEGIDGSGKSTLCRNLHTALLKKDHKTALTKEPGGTLLGKELRAILQTQNVPVCPQAEYLLFAADRSQHFKDLIIPKLNTGYLIISDRMGDSSIAYQGYGRGLSIEMIQQINAWTMQNIEPDISFYVRISAEESKKRIRARGKTLTAFEKERDEFTQRLVHGFDALFKDKKGGIILDGTQTPEELTTLALHHIEQTLSLV